MIVLHCINLKKAPEGFPVGSLCIEKVGLTKAYTSFIAMKELAPIVMLSFLHDDRMSNRQQRPDIRKLPNKIFEKEVLKKDAHKAT
jgi:hypothetical protein